MLERIISGGQTGADRGGLDAAIALGIPHGGCCPKGRRAEDGTVPARYDLEETSSASYQVRTKRNVLDADGTVIFTRGRLAGGSLLTAQAAHSAGKPCLHFDVHQLAADAAGAAAEFSWWLAQHAIRTLNIAGSRESKAPGIEALVGRFLAQALRGGARPYAPEDEHLAPDAPYPIAADAAADYRRKPAVKRQPRRPASK